MMPGLAAGHLRFFGPSRSPKYIVPNSAANSWLYHRITTGGAGSRMPLGGPDLVTTDTNGNGTFDATDIRNWINAGAPGP